MTAGDIIHAQVEKDLAAHPEFAGQVIRQGDGDYLIDGREVKVGFCRQGFLVVHDGPLRQPFTDYVAKNESSAVYHQQGLKSSTLNNLPRERRISFGDEGNRYSRLDAMKVAKEQAKFREQAANYINEGGYVPADLREKYEKTIDQKLGTRRWSAKPSAPQEAVAPAWWPGATSGPSANKQPRSYVPGVPSPTKQAPGAGLFGQIPNLFEVASARGNAQTMAMGHHMPGTMKAPIPMMAAGYPAATVKVPAVGLARPLVAGSRCGA